MSKLNHNRKGIHTPWMVSSIVKKKKKKIVGTTAQAIDWRAFTQYIVVYIDMKLSVRFYFYFFLRIELSVLRGKDDAFQVST